MIEVDYNVLRKEGEDKSLSFSPDNLLKKIDGNAIYLEAPNAKGKSFLLNLLAISLYGHKLEDSDSRISRTLKLKMKSLMQRENQSFTFNMRYSSKDQKIQLISQKESPVSNDIKIEEIGNEGSRILPYQIFKENYYLIYDIPEDPLNRLKEIIFEVQDQQDRYKKKVSEFKSYLEEIKKELAQSRDENEINNLKTKLNEISDEINKKEKKIDENSEKIRIIESYYALREYQNYVKLSCSIGERIERKEKVITNTSRNKKTIDTQYSNKRMDVENKFDEIDLLFTEFIKQLRNIFVDFEDMNSHISDIQKIDLYNSIDTYKLDPAINLKLDYIKKELKKYGERKEIKEAGRKGDFYKEIMRILKSYHEIDVLIPGTDKNIEELINAIEAECKKNEDYIQIYSSIKRCFDILSEIEQHLKELPKKLSTLQLASKRQSEKSSNFPIIDEINEEVKKLDQALGDALDKVNHYKKIVEKHGYNEQGIHDENYVQGEMKNIADNHKDYLAIFQQDENHISKYLEDLLKENEKNNQDISDLERKKSQYSEKLSDINNRDEHRYRSNVVEIEKISKIVDSLEYDIITYSKIINKINLGEELKNDVERNYNEKISQYLALKIPEFPYIDEFITPKRIDILHNKITTDSGREIDMDDISTGQGMSMYIQAILNRPSDDKRKIIAIFDEAATMDSNSFEPIKKTLNRLIESNKLLFALFVKATDGEIKMIKIA